MDIIIDTQNQINSPKSNEDGISFHCLDPALLSSCKKNDRFNIFKKKKFDKYINQTNALSKNQSSLLCNDPNMSFDPQNQCNSYRRNSDHKKKIQISLNLKAQLGINMRYSNETITSTTNHQISSLTPPKLKYDCTCIAEKIPVFASSPFKKQGGQSKEKIPQMIKDQITNQCNAEKENCRCISNESLKGFDILIENKRKLEQSKKECRKFMRELKEAQEARNLIIREVYQMKNELDCLKTLPSCKVSTDLAENLSNKAPPKKAPFRDLNHLIDQLENQLSEVKNKNQQFFETFDVLIQECAENEEQNKILKQTFGNIEASLNASVKEKANLKATINKKLAAAQKK